MFFFDQRACAAFFAISQRLSFESFFALASPPFKPPKRPSATAAGFFSGSSVASETSLAASSLMSSFLLDRLGMEVD